MTKFSLFSLFLDKFHVFSRFVFLFWRYVLFSAICRRYSRSFPRSFDKSCGFLAIFRQNSVFFHNSLMKFAFFAIYWQYAFFRDFFVAMCVFPRSLEKISRAFFHESLTKSILKNLIFSQYFPYFNRHFPSLIAECLFSYLFPHSL